MARLRGVDAEGEPVDPALIYFRCAPGFETSSAALSWITQRVFVGTGMRYPAHGVMRFFEVGCYGT